MSFLKWLLKNDYKTRSQGKTDIPKGESKSRKFLNISRVERLLSQPANSKIRGLRNKTVLEIIFSTGLRVSEIVSLGRYEAFHEKGG